MRSLATYLLCALIVAPTALAAPQKPSPQSYHQVVPVNRPPAAGSGVHADRVAAIKDAFHFGWDGYKKYAFPSDQLDPINNKPLNPRNGWGVTAVDALSTAIIMGLPNVVNDILDFIPTVDFSVSKDNQYVSVFETTIRYLGGMLSAYDLLHEPSFSHLVKDQKKLQSLLKQSESVANHLSFAFDTPSGIPSGNVFFGNRSHDEQSVNDLADIGTLVLEWTRLSDLTGNKTYAELSQKAEKHLLNPMPKSDVPWSGLLGTNVSLETGQFQDALGGWIARDDSFYEYLMKMYIYDQGRFSQYKDRWTLAVDSSIAHLASHSSKHPEFTYLALYDGKDLIEESEYLSCFSGGNFILGGQALGRKDYVDFGLKLVDSCHHVTNTITGLGPEVFGWNASMAAASNQTDYFNEHGFYIIDGVYDLRPEVIESYYYAYQATGNSTYQDWAWDAFQAIKGTCKAISGYSGVYDVNASIGGGFLNSQESFFFAEVLKYSYLIQAGSKGWDAVTDGKNQWVFNTEGHPLKVKGDPI